MHQAFTDSNKGEGIQAYTESNSGQHNHGEDGSTNSFLPGFRRSESVGNSCNSQCFKASVGLVFSLRASVQDEEIRKMVSMEAEGGDLTVPRFSPTPTSNKRGETLQGSHYLQVA